MASQTEEHMLTILQRGDRKIETIKSKVIMEVGLTRVGKSCVFNWAVNRPMIGQGDQIQANYRTMNQDAANARLGSQFTSVTLIPNSAQIDSETTLIDMAGFGDTRNYIGVMGVSYFLKSVFDKAEEVKFLVVFNEHAFFDVTGSAIIRTFEGFFNMFKLELLNTYPQIKKKLFESISFVITRSQSPHLHSAYLQKVIKKISEPKFVAPHKQLLKELGTYMLECNRIHAFPKAKPDQNPEKCDIFQRFKALKWQYLKIHQVQQEIGETIINIPFEADYERLPEEDKKLFTDCIQKRIQSYTGFVAILKTLMGSFKENWKNTIENKLVTYLPDNLKDKLVTDLPDSFMDKLVANLPDNFMDSVLCCKKVFEQIEIFLSESDKYNSQNLINQEIKMEYVRPNLVKSISNILNIYKVADEIGQELGYELTHKSFQDNMRRYSGLFQKLVECIRCFCTSAQQQKLVLRLNFVLKRGFLQFSKFHSINPGQIAQVNQQIKDRCNNTIFSESARDYLDNFIKIMKQPLMTRIFTSISAIEEFQELFEMYKELYQNVPGYQQNRKEIQLLLNRHSINISYVKADIHMKLNDKIQSGLNFVTVIKLLCKQGVIESELDESFNLQSKLIDIYLMKLRAINKLVSILVTLDIKKYADSKDLAISLCKHVKQIDAACEVYDLQLKDYKNDQAKLAIVYKNYADYCIEWGRYSDAKVLLQKKLRLQTVDYYERAQTINTIYSLVEDAARMVEEEKDRVQKLSNRIPQIDNQLNGLLDKIQQLLQINVSQSMSVSFASVNKL